MQRHIGGDRHRPCHRDIAPRAEARIQGGAQPAHLGALRIGLREDIFVDEALARQGGAEIGNGQIFVARGGVEQASAGGGQHPLELAVAHPARNHHLTQQRVGVQRLQVGRIDKLRVVPRLPG